MRTIQRPYFLWDYNVTDQDVRNILAGKNEINRQWIIARILTNAAYADIWQYLTLEDVVKEFPRLRLRSQTKEIWTRALRVWGYHV